MKAPKHKIKFKDLKQCEAMYKAYSHIVESVTPESMHEYLLMEHAAMLRNQLFEALLNEKKSITLNPAEAMAFCQLWSDNNPYDNYANNIISKEREQIIKNSISKNSITDGNIYNR